MRRSITGAVVVALMLVLAGWVVPPSAGAAATPWTWRSVTATGHLAPSEANAVRALCPGGYRAVTGGFDAGSALVLDEGTDSGYFWVRALADPSAAADVSVTAWCVLADQVAIQLVDRTLTPNRSGGYGLGDFACGGDMTPLGASLVWNSSPSEYIDQSGPETIGGTNMWFVVAHGFGTSQSLDVQLLCVANSDLPGAGWATQSQTAGAGGATESVTASCPDRQRLVTGGEHVDSLYGRATTSYPTGAQSWTTVANVPANDTLSVAVLCVPDGDPVASFTGGPSSPTSYTTATFSFTAVDPAAASRASNWCFLNTVYLGACTDNYTVTGLTEGQNVFSVEALTDDGRGGAATEKDYYFQVDLTPPTISVTPPPAFTLGKTVTLKASGTDSQGIDFYQFVETARQAAGAGAGTAQPVVTHHVSATGLLSLPVKPGMSYRFDVKVFDIAGNASQVRSVSTAVPLDNAALTASSQWTVVKSAVYTNTLVSRTRAKGATLTHSMYGRTLGVVATTCPSCGQVGVYAGSTLLTTINLRSSSIHYQQVFTVPLGTAPVQRQVILKVLSTNRLVEIDGLGASVT